MSFGVHEIVEDLMAQGMPRAEAVQAARDELKRRQGELVAARKRAEKRSIERQRTNGLALWI